MKVFDLHCDTISHVAWGLADGLSGSRAPKHITVEKLKKGGSFIQCLGLYGGQKSSNDFLLTICDICLNWECDWFFKSRNYI